MIVGLREGRHQPLAALAVQGRDALAQPRDRGGEIVALALQRREPLLDLRRLCLGDEVDGAHAVALARQALQLGVGIGARRHFLARLDAPPPERRPARALAAPADAPGAAVARLLPR